jgi:hypothetical protein
MAQWVAMCPAANSHQGPAGRAIGTSGRIPEGPETLAAGEPQLRRVKQRGRRFQRPPRCFRAPTALQSIFIVNCQRSKGHFVAFGDAGAASADRSALILSPFRAILLYLCPVVNRPWTRTADAVSHLRALHQSEPHRWQAFWRNYRHYRLQT